MNDEMITNAARDSWADLKAKLTPHDYIGATWVLLMMGSMRRSVDLLVEDGVIEADEKEHSLVLMLMNLMLAAYRDHEINQTARTLGGKEERYTSMNGEGEYRA